MSAKFNFFNRSAAIRLRDEMQALLNKYGQEANVEFVFNGARFTPENVTLKIEAKIKGSATLREQKRNSALAPIVKQMNLTTEVVNGRQLVGYDSRKYKYPFIYRDVKTEKMYKCNLASAKLYFSQTEVRAA